MTKGSDEKDAVERLAPEGLDRREFTLQAMVAMLSGVAITISGCGGGGGGNPNQPNPQPQPSSGDKIGNISANHGHRAVIEAAKLSAGAAIVLDIRGDADHPHTVSLSASEMAAIAAGQRVGKGSSDDDFHTHTVTFN